jgi:hypothetical protein
MKAETCEVEKLNVHDCLDRQAFKPAAQANSPVFWVTRTRA